MLENLQSTGSLMSFASVVTILRGYVNVTDRQIDTMTDTRTHVTAFFQDYLGGPVPER